MNWKRFLSVGLALFIGKNRSRFKLVSIRAHTLRDIGKVPLWLLRRTEDEMSLLDKARMRREIGRAWIEERFGTVLDLGGPAAPSGSSPDDAGG